MTKSELFAAKVVEAKNEYFKQALPSLRLLEKYRQLETEKREEAEAEQRDANRLYREMAALRRTHGKEQELDPQPARDAEARAEAAEQEASRYHLIKCNVAQRVGLLQQRLAYQLYAAFAGCFKCDNIVTGSKRSCIVIEALKAAGVELRYLDTIVISGTNLYWTVRPGAYQGADGYKIEAASIANELQNNAENLAEANINESEIINQVNLLLQAQKMLIAMRAKYIAEAQKALALAKGINLDWQVSNKLAISYYELLD